MFTNSTDREWEKFGREDPYFGVLTDERYRMANLNDANRLAFFSSGELYIANLWNRVKAHVDADFAPRRALDFGCGVGRLIIPLAERVAEVTGLDVSDSMLAEARHNCETRNLDNVVLVPSDDELSGLSGHYDFVHSLIVFQHIPVARGVRIFARLLACLAPGGVGVVQFTYAKAHPQKAWVRLAKSRIPFAARVANLLRGRSLSCPEMQMNSYDLNTLLRLLQKSGVERFHGEFTDHGGELGVILYFRKQQSTR